MCEVPEKAMGRKSITTTLGEILELNSEEQPRYFNHSLRADSGLRYRIPEHQRYPQWNSDQKQRLLDSIFRDYPMSGVVVSSHYDDNGLYFDFEDGQTRLSILQDFYMNEFTYELENGSSAFFKDLSRSSQRRFENYKINIEELYDASKTDISEVFDRLQNGRPLSDKDLYWNRKDQFPYVNYGIDLIKEPYWKSIYMNTEKGVTDKHRVSLPDIITLIYAIINYHYIKSKYTETSMSKRKSFGKCYRSQVNEMKNEVSTDDKLRIKTFLEHLNKIIDAVYQAVPRSIKPKEKINTWANLAKQTGMILYEWLENEHESDEFHQTNREKWVDIMQIERKSGDFMYRGKKTLWNGLRSAHKQNTDDLAIFVRLNRVNDFYSNPEEISAENGIHYNDGDGTDDESNETDSE